MGSSKSNAPSARCRIWLTKDGETVFGDGRVRILEAIRKYGSMNKAAKELKMSYRALWGKIKKSETLLGAPLVEPAVVKGHRGSRLSKSGENLLREFTRFKKESLKAVDSCYRRTVGKLCEIMKLGSDR